MSKIKKLSLAFGLVTASLSPIPAFAFWGSSCPVDSSTPRAYTKSQLNAHTESVKASLSTMDVSVNNAMNSQTALITAALETLATQKALSAKQIAAAVKNNSQIQTSALQQIEVANRLMDTVDTYGPGTTGFKACQVHKKRQGIHESKTNSDAYAASTVSSEITARPGSYGDRQEALAVRLALHNKYYCTSDQVASGLCLTEGSEAGASLRAQTLLQNTSSDGQDYRNKTAFINNMVGLPDSPVPSTVVASSEGQAYSDLKRHKDAIKSTAMTALKGIQAQTTAISDQHGHVHSGSHNHKQSTSTLTEKDQLSAGLSRKDDDADTNQEAQGSLLAQIESDAGRYLGGSSEYKDWSVSLVGMPEKGVLTEVLRIKALQLFLQAENYSQLMQMEAMMAAQLSADIENNGMDARIENQQRTATSNAITQRIKDQESKN